MAQRNAAQSLQNFDAAGPAKSPKELVSLSDDALTPHCGIENSSPMTRYRPGAELASETNLQRPFVIKTDNLGMRQASKYQLARMPESTELFGINQAARDHRTRLLTALLAPICPDSWGGRPVLWPIWADEMAYRNLCLVQLAGLLETANAQYFPFHDRLTGSVASDLAATVRTLIIGNDHERFSCSTAISNISHNLVELFGQGVRNIILRTQLEPLQLPAFRRRALALVAFNLISNALMNGFWGTEVGYMEIELVRTTPTRGKFLISHSGRIEPVPICQKWHRIGDDLASLLESEITYCVTECGGGVALIEFPV